LPGETAKLLRFFAAANDGRRTRPWPAHARHSRPDNSASMITIAMIDTRADDAPMKAPKGEKRMFV
jgi:hypothetical protein